MKLSKKKNGNKRSYRKVLREIKPQIVFPKSVYLNSENLTKVKRSGTSLINASKQNHKLNGGDLVNRSFCKNGSEENPQPALNGREYNKHKRIMSPGFEILMSSDAPFELTHSTLYRLIQFNRATNRWFKFVIFNFKGENHLYLLNGNPENNKHPMCMVYGFLEHSSKDEYPLFRAAIENLLKLKENIDKNVINIETVDEDNEVIVNFNRKLYENFGCMHALSAGSGTILEDGTICLNNKSGHFKPGMGDLEIAREMFNIVTGQPVRSRIAAHKDLVIKELSSVIPKFNYDNYSGTCLRSEDADN